MDDEIGKRRLLGVAAGEGRWDSIQAGGSWAGDGELYPRALVFAKPRKFASSVEIALLAAAREASPIKVGMALEMGANPNFEWSADVAGEGDGTALHALAQSDGGKGWMACLKMLMEVCDMRARNSMGHTPLMCAVFHQSPERVAAMACGPWCLAQDDGGATALMHAAASGRKKAVMALLPHSDPLAVNCRGETALMLAAGAVRGEWSEMIKMLLGGSNANARDHFGRNALMIAAGNGGCSLPGLEALMEASDPWACDSQGLDAAFFEAKAFGRREFKPVKQWMQREAERRELEVASGRAEISGKKPRL